MTPAKAVAKKYIPARQWRRLSAARGRVASLPTSPVPTLVDLIVRGIQALPPAWAVSVKERLQLRGRLDYPSAIIPMVLDSRAQLKRLRACGKEPETVAWIESHVGPGDVFYDVGANVGAYSFVAYHAAQASCSVYAFEPSYSTFAALCENIALNGCQERIIPLNVALAGRTALLQLSYSSTRPGAASHQFDATSSAASLVQPVLSYRLDDLISAFDLPLPNHVKLDADGPELAILSGAERTLDSPGLRSLLVEVDEAQYHERQIPHLLERHGFVVASRHLRHGSQYNYIFERADATRSSH